jgi:hypothetical protein
MLDRLRQEQWWQRSRWWQKIVTLLLAPAVFVISFTVVLLLVGFVCLWNGTVYCIYWIRWKRFGTPIPEKNPPPPA